jgi:tRNA pseudouridine55 synthase
LKELHGVLVVDKPAGPTSHDVVESVRRALGVRKAGHTGTLDPFATGVLAVCLGQATRLVRFLAAGEKLYRARVRLGYATSTDDLQGEPLGEPAAMLPSDEQVRAACARLVGPLLQVPPAFSAKRVAGRRAYDVARRGGAPALDAVPVSVHALDLLATSGAELELEVRCSSGTYVRALARDLGRDLGVGGHLVALRRLRSDGFGLERAVPLDEVGTRADAVIPLAAMLPELPSVVVGDEGLEALGHGRDLLPGHVLSGFPAEAAAGRFRIVDAAGALLALAVPRGFRSATAELPLQPVLHADVVLVRP